jgi:hypothetical protein
VTATRRQRRRWLVVAASGLVLSWVVAPAAIPIYDGIGNPDEPYRYVNPPASAKTTKAPGDGQAVLPVRNGTNPNGQYANTGESGPQLSYYMPAHAFQVPPSATSVRVTAKPLAPTAPLPKDGTIVTNVYRIAATTDGGQPVKVTGSGPSEPSLQMRAPDARQPGPVFEHRTSSGWERARTIRVAVDVYQAQAPALGDWALVRLKSTPAGGGGSGIKWGLLGPGIALLVVAVVVLMVRLRRTSAAATDG